MAALVFVNKKERDAEYYRQHRDRAIAHAEAQRRAKTTDIQARIDAALEAERRREARELAELEKAPEDEE